MDDMFINGIVSMKSFNDRFGKRITNFSNHIFFVINEHNALS